MNIKRECVTTTNNYKNQTTMNNEAKKTNVEERRENEALGDRVVSRANNATDCGIKAKQDRIMAAPYAARCNGYGKKERPARLLVLSPPCLSCLCSSERLVTEKYIPCVFLAYTANHSDCNSSCFSNRQLKLNAHCSLANNRAHFAAGSTRRELHPLQPILPLEVSRSG